MIALYVVLGLALAILCVFIVMGFIIQGIGFSKRFNPDPLVKYYTNLEFNIKRAPLEVKCHKETLRGFIYNKDAIKKDAVVVFAHGMYATVDAYNQEICTICQRGYEVIALNHAGVDTSTGSRLEGIGGSLKALKATIEYINNSDEYKGRKIYVVGHSWGGYAALNIRAYYNVDKIVALAPYASANRLLLNLLPRSLKAFTPFVIFADICKNGFYCTKNAARTLRKHPGNVLVLHSTNDPMVSYELNTGYLMDKVDGVEYLIFKRNGHNPTYTEEAVEYMREYTDELSCTKPSEQNKLKEKTDFHKMGELNKDTMNEIVSFLNK